MPQNQLDNASTSDWAVLNAFEPKSYGPSEVTQLRKAGRLEEAYAKGKAQLEGEPSNLWAKRDMGWVLYSLLKGVCAPEQYDQFYTSLQELAALQLPDDEKMLFDQVSWQIGKLAFALLKLERSDTEKLVRLWEVCQGFSFTKPSEGYSFLFKAFHKALKEHHKYISFADSWGFSNFRVEDYQKEKLPSGKEVMSVVEQAYIAYAKQLLPKHTQFGETSFDREKVLAFMPMLDKIIEAHAEYQYPGYFKAKLLLALGNQENLLAAILPFAKKKKNDFWVWDVLSEAFPHDEEKQIACFCKALSCNAPDEFLINIRQKVARWLIAQKMYPEAKTEINLAKKAREGNEWKIPGEIAGWIGQTWYKEAVAQSTNNHLYQKYLPLAESILYADVPEEIILVDFVNSDKKIANFINNERKTGFFKYDRFFRSLNPGDILSVRFSGNPQESHYKLLTAEVQPAGAAKLFNVLKSIKGTVRIAEGKPFGFIEDVFVHPSIVDRFKLKNSLDISGLAVMSYNRVKNEWGWKLININKVNL